MAIYPGVMSAVLKVVERHRGGEAVDTTLLKNISASFGRMVTVLYYRVNIIQT